MGKSKKVASYRVNLFGTWIIITKYNETTHHFDVLYEKDFKTERPDLYKYLNSAKRIKELMRWLKRLQIRAKIGKNATTTPDYATNNATNNATPDYATIDNPTIDNPTIDTPTLLQEKNYN